MTHPNSAIACPKCRYWQEVAEDDGDRLGVCRRLPPSYEGWPMTRTRDWCGEYFGLPTHGGGLEPAPQTH